MALKPVPRFRNYVYFFMVFVVFSLINVVVVCFFSDFSQELLDADICKVEVKKIKLPSKGESSKRTLFDHPSQESKARVGAALRKPELGHKTSSAQVGSSFHSLNITTPVRICHPLNGP